MKLGPIPKLDKRNKTTSKMFDHNVMSKNCDVIATFPIYGRFGAIRKTDSGGIVCKTYIFINSNLLSCKNWKQNLKSFNSSQTIALSKGTILAKKRWFFAKKWLPMRLRLHMRLHLRLRMSLHLRLKFYVSSIIPLYTPKKSTQISETGTDAI